MLTKTMAFGIFISIGSCLSIVAQEMPAPSAEHKIVLRDVGQWTVTGKVMMPEGMQEFKGEEKVVAVGEFWTVSHFSADMFGGLKGSSTMGYDPMSKKFVGTWVDSFQPAVTHMAGSYDESSKTMTYETKGLGMDGKPMPGKIIIKYQDENSHTFTMMHKDPTGQSDELVTTMEMTYIRKNAGNAK